MENNLKNETSPYLLQHKTNPVNWYPWGERAFEKAKTENKPIFLSIGYSTCHWCHVMAHESFENKEIAEILNKNFVSIKVDREERPDVDSIYMSVCQAFTGSGGWPMSIFITHDQKPFFAGTYFPKQTLKEILNNVTKIWLTDKESLLKSGDEVINNLIESSTGEKYINEDLPKTAVNLFLNNFDEKYGGFGYAPKFPSPHNLLFLMNYYTRTKNKSALKMAEKTLLQMYRGGIFDHIGFGFSRYSTDKFFLVPHFEKMLYDNALLMQTFITAYNITEKEIYKTVAEKTAQYIIKEMTSKEGGFYSAQDADSNGVEGRYYLFDYDEIIKVLGKETGEKFNSYYSVTQKGNFEGKNILNLLNNNKFDGKFDECLSKLYEYRKSRMKLHLDDKTVCVYNSLAIAAFAAMHRCTGNKNYFDVAKRACDFTENNLCENNTLYVSYRDKKRSVKGFLDDYAFYIYALINMYESSGTQKYLDRAICFANKACENFYDAKDGGFYLYGKDNEKLILKPKETYDGAIPSGNSVMAYNLVRINQLTNSKEFGTMAKNQLEFMSESCKDYPASHSFFMLALDMFLNPISIVCTIADTHEKFPLIAAVKVVNKDNTDYPLINGKTTYYVCKNKNCLPPVNSLKEIL